MTSPAKKKLTYIVNYLSADDAQHYVHIPNLLTELEKIGWEIDLVSERGGQGLVEVLGTKVTYLSRTSKAWRVVNLVLHLIEMKRSGGTLVFVRISKDAALVSAVLGRILGWRTVYWLSGAIEDFNLAQGAKARAQFTGMRLLMRLIDRLATGPEGMVRYYRQTYGLPRRKIIMLYNDVDVRSAGLEPERAASEELRILMVHRLSPVRETDRYFPALINALSNVAQFRGIPVRLDICGDGPEKSVLQQIAGSASDIDIHFHGAVPQRQLARYYDRATLFVMPSYREGFPRVIIEAMAHGLPIVTTDAGGTADLLGPEQQAYVVGRDDAASFGAAVERVLSSAETIGRLGIENLDRVTRFSTPEVARMYDRALSTLIGVPPTAHPT